METGSSSEILDPRIKGELERLNATSEDINRLEREIDNIRHQFRHTLTESSQKLTETGKKCIKAIHRANPYHEAKKAEREAHEQAQNAALKYQRAVSMLRAAKETISIAEEASMEGSNKKRDFDSALQELLNHATMKLNEAEKEKIAKEKEHEERSRNYIAAQKRVEQQGKKHKKSIAKSAHYFDLRESFYQQLNGMKINMESLQRQVLIAKKQYRQALKNLESISDEIHQSRELNAILAVERSRGVGADSSTSDGCESSRLELDSLNLDETIAEKIETLPKDNDIDEHGDRESDIDGASSCASPQLSPSSPNPYCDIFGETNFTPDSLNDKQHLDGNGNAISVIHEGSENESGTDNCNQESITCGESQVGAERPEDAMFKEQNSNNDAIVTEL